MLCESPSPVSLAKLSKSLEVDAGNLHRLLQMLQDEGWIARLLDSNEYTVGPLLMSNFDPWHPIQGFRRDAYNILEKLHHETRETTVMVLFLGQQRVVVDAIHGRLALSSYYDVRLTSPLHGSASGLILLSGVSAESLDKILGPGPYSAHAPKTCTSREEIESRLKQIRKDGYAISREEGFAGVVAYGAPICYRGKSLGCLVITASSNDISKTDDKHYAQQTKISAESLATSSPFVHQLKFLIHG